MRSIPHLRVTLVRSRLEALFSGVVHTAALVTPWFTSLPRWASAGVCTTVAASAVYFGYRWWKQGGVELTLERDGSWQLRVGDEDLHAEVDGAAYLGNGLVMLPLKLESGERRRIVAWPDSAPAQQLRRFRVWVRWGEPGYLAPEDQARPETIVGAAAGKVAG